MQCDHCIQMVLHTKNYREQMSPIGPYFQLNSPNNFSANRSVVFKSMYVIVLRLGKTFEDHVFQSNQLGSQPRSYLNAGNGLNNGMGTGGIFFSDPPLARNSRFALATRSPRARLAFASACLKYAKNFACSAD